MMATDLLLILARINLVAGLAVVLVLLLRAPARRLFGAHCGYGLWLTVPFAIAGSLMPPHVAAGRASLLETILNQLKAWLGADSHAQALMVLWLIGLIASAAFVIWRQARFLSAAKAGLAGPAVVGVIGTRVVAPADIAQRFTPEERRLVRAHERAHMDRLDARYNAAAVLARCAGWFNPLLHLAAPAMRLDQEIACDATVMERLPSMRRSYAEALLRSSGAVADLPLGCQWTARGAHPLETRLNALVNGAPTAERRDFGSALLLILCATAFAGGWALEPPYRAPVAPMVNRPCLGARGPRA